MEWRLDPMMNHTVSLVNRSGDDAVEVVISTVGPVVVGGQRDWSRNFGRVHRGASVEIRSVAKGWSSERSGLRVTWHGDDGTNRPRIETHWLS